jgi:hypothetical protein
VWADLVEQEWWRGRCGRLGPNEPVLVTSQGEPTMYKGTVRKGTVVLEPGASLPDGAEVRVALASEPAKRVPATDFRAEKEKMWQALRGMAGGVSVEEVLENVYLLYKIEKGVRQLDDGQGVSHEEARQRFSRWLE